MYFNKTRSKKSDIYSTLLELLLNNNLNRIILSTLNKNLTSQVPSRQPDAPNAEQPNESFFFLS